MIGWLILGTFFVVAVGVAFSLGLAKMAAKSTKESEDLAALAEIKIHTLPPRDAKGRFMKKENADGS